MSTTGTQQAVYQFDDDSILKFARAIANAVSERYVSPVSLPKELVNTVCADRNLISALGVNKNIEINVGPYTGPTCTTEAGKNDLIGRAVTIDPTGGTYILADVDDPIIGIVSHDASRLIELANKYGITISATPSENAGVTDVEENALKEEEGITIAVLGEVKIRHDYTISRGDYVTIGSSGIFTRSDTQTNIRVLNIADKYATAFMSPQGA